MYDRIIVTEPARDLRAIARQALAGKWQIAILGAFLYLAIASIPRTIIGVFVYSPYISWAYTLLITAPLVFGFTIFTLKLFRNIQTGPGEVFYGFEFIGKAVLLHLLVFLFTFLWALLFIIPGIIASYRYRMAIYILADNPEKDVMQCINESKWLMEGNKFHLWYLDLTFIGWNLLIYFVSVFCVTIAIFFTSPVAFLSTLDVTMIPFGLELFASVIMTVGQSLLLPYTTMAEITFYEVLCGRVNPRPQVYQGSWTQQGGPGPQGPNNWNNQSNWNNQNGWGNQPGNSNHQNWQNPNGWNQQGGPGANGPNGWQGGPGPYADQNQPPSYQNPQQGNVNPFEPVAAPEEEEPVHYGFWDDPNEEATETTTTPSPEQKEEDPNDPSGSR